MATLQNVYFFTGQETYLLDKELLRRKENFLAKFGPDSVFQFTLLNMDFGQIKQAIYSGGLFTTKKLIIIHGLPPSVSMKNEVVKEEQGQGSDLKNQFIDYFLDSQGKIPEDSLLVFVNPIPDKRTRLYKFLEKHAHIKEFTQLKNNDLEQFVVREFQDFIITPHVVQYFLTKVGNNLYRVWFECDKLKTRAKVQGKTSIDESMIDTVVFGHVTTDSFAFLKMLFTNTKKAIALLEKIQSSGIDRNMFVGMLYWAIKFYLFMLDLEENGIKNPKDIALILKMNPWQVKNEYTKIELLRSYKKNIEIFYNNIIELDASIKLGKLPDTYFWLGIKKCVYELMYII